MAVCSYLGKSTIALDLIQLRSRLELPASWGRPNNSTQDHPKKLSKCQHQYKYIVPRQLSTQSHSQVEGTYAIQCSRFPTCTRNKAAKVHKKITSKDLLWDIPICLWRNWQVPRSSIYYTSRSQCTAKTNTLQASTHTSERNIQTGYRQDAACQCVETSTEAAPWINSFVLVESKDKSETTSWKSAWTLLTWTRP